MGKETIVEAANNTKTQLITKGDALKREANAFEHASLSVGLLADIVTQPTDGDNARIVRHMGKLRGLETSELPGDKAAFELVRPFLEAHGEELERLADGLGTSTSSRFVSSGQRAVQR